MSPNDFIIPMILALIGICVCVGWGVWQIRRSVNEEAEADLVRPPKSLDVKRRWELITPKQISVRLTWSVYRTARRGRASIGDAIQMATDTVEEFRKSGKLVIASVTPTPPPPATSTASRILGLAQAILVNGVTLTGVLRMRWPIGTALALYWSETAIATLLLILLVKVLRSRRGVDSADTGDTMIALVVGSAAHLVFLVLFLTLVVPHYSLAERFDRVSFREGLIFIALLLVMDFLIRLSAMRTMTAAGLEQTAAQPLRRMLALHFTIVLGMWALAIFGSLRAFFAVFCGFKILFDLGRGAK